MMMDETEVRTRIAEAQAARTRVSDPIVDGVLFKYECLLGSMLPPAVGTLNAVVTDALLNGG